MTDTLLGNLLIKAKIITPDILDQALKIQNVQPTPLPLGNILVNQKYCTNEQIKTVLSIQEGLRSTKRVGQALATALLAAVTYTQGASTIPEQTQRLKKISETIVPLTAPCKDE